MSVSRTPLKSALSNNFPSRVTSFSSSSLSSRRCSSSLDLPGGASDAPALCIAPPEACVGAGVGIIMLEGKCQSVCGWVGVECVPLLLCVRESVWKEIL